MCLLGVSGAVVVGWWWPLNCLCEFLIDMPLIKYLRRRSHIIIWYDTIWCQQHDSDEAPHHHTSSKLSSKQSREQLVSPEKISPFLSTKLSGFFTAMHTLAFLICPIRRKCQPVTYYSFECWKSCFILLQSFSLHSL